VAGDKLSAKEAALIAQARAALMEAARAEHARERERLRKFYVWVPLALVSVLGLWTLAWLWTKI